jgi:hypothetical protein
LVVTIYPFLQNRFVLIYILRELSSQSLSLNDYGQVNVLLDVNLCVPRNSKVGRIPNVGFCFFLDGGIWYWISFVVQVLFLLDI